MNRIAAIKVGFVALLIGVYIVVAALEINHTVLAPIIVALIAAILFLPFGRKERPTDAGSDERSGDQVVDREHDRTHHQ